MLQIRCKNNKKIKNFRIGSTLSEIFDEFDLDMPFGPVSAKVNNKVEGLNYRVYHNKDVEFLDLYSSSGQRSYTRTLFFVLCKAVHDLYPDGHVKIDIPVSNGYYCDLSIGHPVSDADAAAILGRMRRIVAEAHPIRRHETTTEKAIEMFRALGTYSKVKLLESVGLTQEHFGEMINPAVEIGSLTEEVQKMTGLGALPVIAVAGHDTGSAVAAVPAKDEKFAYLSSGTWSLMGIETKDAIINGLSYERNFTNEGGIEGTTRFLKNICGMWLYERCRKEWTDAPKSHTELQAEAMKQPAFQSIINPDDAMFANPASMVDAIQEYCRKTGQHVPEGYAEICRCIFDSLALRYRQVFGYLQEMASFPIEVLHIIGGGSLNNYLNQFTADSLGVEVLAGPQEGTAIGNIMLQAKASGDVSDIWDMRHIIANSIELKRFEPKDRQIWDKAYEKFLEITKN